MHVPATDVPRAKAARPNVSTISNYRSASASDQKKQMSGTDLTKLPLTPAQATEVNAWLRIDESKALSFLTPAQQARLR